MTQLSQNDLDWFAARLSIAVYETQKLGPMPIQDIIGFLKPEVEGADGLSMTYALNGNQVFHIGDRSVEVSPMASNEEIKAAFLNPFIPTANTKMSITGANSLKAKFEAAKQRKAAIEARVETALNSYNGAADIAESAIKSLEDDAAALQAEVSGFTNGAPE